MTKENKSLLNGRFLTCPRCEVTQDILTYVPLQEISEYAAQTQPIYKCRNCKFLFALSNTYEHFGKGNWKVTEE